MNIPTRPATPDTNAAAGGLLRACPLCSAEPGKECATSGGAPLPGYYVYANDHQSRERVPGVHSARIALEDYRHVTARLVTTA